MIRNYNTLSKNLKSMHIHNIFKLKRDNKKKGNQTIGRDNKLQISSQGRVTLHPLRIKEVEKQIVKAWGRVV